MAAASYEQALQAARCDAVPLETCRERCNWDGTLCERGEAAEFDDRLPPLLLAAREEQ